MLIIYDTRSKKIKGLSMIINDSSGRIQQPSKRSTLKKLIPNIGTYVAPDDLSVANEIYKFQLKFDKRGNPVGIEKKPPKPRIELSTDAPDHDNDGVPEIPADGESRATITANIRDHTGNLLTDVVKEISFETTGGILLERNVKTVNGVARTTLQSVRETLIPEIIATAEGCIDGSVKIEFVHPDLVYF